MTGPQYDATKAREVIPYHLNSERNCQITTDEARQALKNAGYSLWQKDATFYDLLPPGVIVDQSTLTADARYVSDMSGMYVYSQAETKIESVKLVDNWKGTGRTMMIAKVTATYPEDIEVPYSESNGELRGLSYLSLDFRAYYS